MIDKIDCEFATTVDGKEVWMKGYYLQSVPSERPGLYAIAMVICRTTGRLLTKDSSNVRFPQFAVRKSGE